MAVESLRESLEATGAEMAPTDSPSVGVEASEPTSTPAQPEASSTPAPVTEGRDSSGRFISKSTGGNAPAQATPTATPTDGVASSTKPPEAATATATEPPKPGDADTTAAPQSWRLGARQDWEKAPPSIKQEVWRREQELQRTMQQAAPARRFQQEMERTLAPIAPAAQARGTTPQALISSYVQFDQALTSRDPTTQAHAVAQVIKAYGVDIETLAKAIDGQLGPSMNNARQEARFDPEVERARIRQEMRSEIEAQSHQQRVAEFSKKADPTLFNEEIRHDMAALIEAAAARGVDLSLEDAYNRAVRANPDAWAITQQREQAKAAPTQQQATAKAMAAGSSVKSRSASPVGGESKGNSIRDDLEAVAAIASGR